MKLVYPVHLTFTEMQMTEKLRRVLCSRESVKVYTSKFTDLEIYAVTQPLNEIISPWRFLYEALSIVRLS